MKRCWAYMITNARRTTFYIGVPNDLARRPEEHRIGDKKRLTSTYNRTYLLYCEETSDGRTAIEREKHLKKRSQTKKEHLTDTLNPQREDFLAWFEMTVRDVGVSFRPQRSGIGKYPS